MSFPSNPILPLGQLNKQSPEWVYGQTPQLTLSVPPPDGSPTPGEIPQPPGEFNISITANKGIIESVDTAAHPALSGLVGKKFDGGVINDHISESGCGRMEIETIDVAGTWIEGILGRTKWGR